MQDEWVVGIRNSDMNSGRGLPRLEFKACISRAARVLRLREFIRLVFGSVIAYLYSGITRKCFV